VKQVGINVLWLVPGMVGGSEESTTETLRALVGEAPEDIRYTLFALAPFATAHPDLAEAVETVTLSLPGRLKALRVAGESTWLANEVRRRRLDLMHHAGGTMPVLRGAPGVLTLHDLQPFDFPAHFNATKRRYLGVAVPRSIAAARLVLTPSEFVRRSVISRFGTDPGKVLTVRHGVAPPLPGTPGREVRERYDLHGPLFLYPAISYPHKNHRIVVEAMASVVAEEPTAMLVLTNRPAESEPDIVSLARRLGIDARVRRLGRIPAADLLGLYDEATAVTFPSVYEGFGLPVLEAMARGCPVVAADATALPEVIAGAGILVPPDDSERWSQTMIQLMHDSGERERLIVAGRARAAELTWAATARGVIAAHRRALDPA
jgi:glycosyltransferase involved in cell wall biosynthesis